MCEFIDYTKPIKSDLDEGDRISKFIKILESKPSKYDAEKQIEEAIKNLRKQGVKI